MRAPVHQHLVDTHEETRKDAPPAQWGLIINRGVETLILDWAK